MIIAKSLIFSSLEVVAQLIKKRLKKTKSKEYFIFMFDFKQFILFLLNLFMCKRFCNFGLKSKQHKLNHKMTNFDKTKMLQELGLKSINQGTSTGKNSFSSSNETMESYSPVDGLLIGKVSITSKEDYEKVLISASEAFIYWRKKPAPFRGEIVRQFGQKLRLKKEVLGKLVSYEMGKSYQEGLGEVQEMIDICDFAVGLSRQLHGFTMHSERPGHRMYEQYHPLGIVGIISAFNFPVAVWAWNTALAWICGDVCVWKPSEKTPLCGIACQQIIAEVLAENNLPEGISCLINGDYKVGEFMTKDTRIPLISATGSTRMGKIVAKEVAGRLGKSLLELGGNNAIIVTPDADIKMTVIGAVFGAVGTAGQRCTSTRRLIIHESIYDKVKDAVVKAYGQLKIGNPLDEKNHVGPLIDIAAVKMYENALLKVVAEGGKILVEGGVLCGEGFESGCYVKPAIAAAENSFEIVQHETFAPILYLIKYSGDVMNAIDIQNGVAQGLSSAIMTNNLREAEAFLSVNGSDCGIANVNIGTSGAEIGGAFGGEKETGGGRESGSDAWKVYMRRQTNTINYTTELPLAQGIKFDL
jgi:aldehyde dehydrogenase (NAD+)